MKVIISQGQGKLHLNETSAALKRGGAGILYITGWLPKKLNPWFVNSIGKIIGRKELYKLLLLRHPQGLSDKEVIACGKVEFYYWLLMILSKLRLINHDKAITNGWKFWGTVTKKYISNADVFHVRSGAGQGGAIKRAKENGVVVVADHSIAHPVAIAKYLKSEYLRFRKTFDLDPDTRFWSLILKDCVDADYILVNSDFVKETFIENGFPADKIKVVYLGVRDDFIGLKKSWMINVKEIRLLFTGTFSLRKGARVLIEAVEILNARGYNIVVEVVGSLDELNEIEAVCKMPVNIHFHGSVIQDELKQFLQTSDIYIFPTFAEGCARSAMEAMGAGLPVVTTPNCGLPIVHNETGVIIPINDAEALANEVERLINDNQLRETIGKKAFSLVADNYTWSEYGRKLIEFYREICSNKY